MSIPLKIFLFSSYIIFFLRFHHIRSLTHTYTQVGKVMIFNLQCYTCPFFTNLIYTLLFIYVLFHFYEQRFLLFFFFILFNYFSTPFVSKCFLFVFLLRRINNSWDDFFNLIFLKTEQYHFNKLNHACILYFCRGWWWLSCLCKFGNEM